MRPKAAAAQVPVGREPRAEHPVVTRTPQSPDCALSPGGLAHALLPPAVGARPLAVTRYPDRISSTTALSDRAGKHSQLHYADPPHWNSDTNYPNGADNAS